MVDLEVAGSEVAGDFSELHPPSGPDSGLEVLSLEVSVSESLLLSLFEGPERESVLYQPPPLKMTPVAEITLLRVACEHCWQSVRASSLKL